MASGKAGLQIYIGATTQDLQSGLEEAKRSIDGWARDAVTKMNQAAAGTKPAAQGFTSLGDAARKFAAEQRGELRTARFFVSELAAIVPVSSDVKGALVGVGAAIVGGGGAFSAIQLATTAWTYFAQEAEAAAKKLKETDDLIRTSQGAWESYAASLSGASGAAKVFAAEQAKLTSALLKAQQALLDAQIEANLAEELAGKDPVGAFAALIVSLFSTGSAAETAEEQIRKLNQALEINRALAEEAKRAEQGPRADKAIAEQRRRHEQEMREAVQKAHAKDTSGEASAGAFYALEAEYYDPKAIAAVAEKVAEEMKRQLAAAHAKDTSGEATIGGFFDLEASSYDPADAARAAQKAQEEYNKEVERSAVVAQQWGDAIGASLGQLIAGGASAQQVLASILQMAVKEATAYAITAAIGAAKSQAPIPGVGPVLAISAAGTVLSQLLGMVGGIGKASRGYRVPDWVGSAGVTTVLHPGEHVLPRRISRNYEKGGGGGNTFNITGVTDPRRVAEEVARHERKAQRRRGS